MTTPVVDNDELKNLNWRFAYHKPKTEEVIFAHQIVRDHCLGVARHFSANLPPGREKSLAITKLEEAMFWANAAIARQKEEEK